MKRAELLADRRAFIETTMKVVDKGRQLVPFRLKPAQADLLAAESKLLLVPKARQLGITTLGQADMLAECCIYPNTAGLLAVQTDEDTRPIGERLLDLWANMAEVVNCDDGPMRVKPGLVAESAHRYKFSNGSQVLVRTANSIRAARGIAFHRVHGTEVALWDDDATRGFVTAALGASGAVRRFRCVLESTGNGTSGLFYSMVMAALQGHSSWAVRFYNWLLEPGYQLDGPAVGELNDDEEAIRAAGGTDANIRWWRAERLRFGPLLDTGRLRQEYPLTLAECFQSFGIGVFTAAEIGTVVPAEPISWEYNGAVRVWELPQPGVQYVLVTDPSSGTSADPSAVTVQRADNLRHVLSLEGWYEPPQLALVVQELAYRYNQAVLVVERNTGYGADLLRLLEQQYQYERLFYDEARHIGWHTNRQSKELAVGQFRSALASGFSPDYRVAEQMQAFVRDKGNMAAKGHGHDDILMCLIIGTAVAQLYPWLFEPLHRQIVRYADA